MAAAEGSSAGSSSAADSYLGSLISLTSKSEIRYEGVLYNVNTEESSIGLRNVRSFGTEGRKKDGPQIPPGDKVYDYILFRGSDIKDLQVKSSPPAQPAPAPAPSINNDPAIIQSHYPGPIPTPTAMPSAAAAPTTDVGRHTSQMGLAPNFQGGLPLYQPGSNMGAWGASLLPPTANPGGLAMPMYWQGYYGSPSPIPQMHAQTLLRPPPGLSVPPPPLPQPNHHINNSLSGGASNLHDTSSPLLSMSSSLVPMTSTSLPSMMPPVSLPTLASEKLSSSLPTNKDLISGLPLASSANALTIGATKDSITMLPPGPVPQPGHLLGTSISVSTENPAPTPIPSLVTPGQLLPPGPINISLSESSQIAQKDVEVVLVSSPPSPPPAEPLEPAVEAQPPILPLPPLARTGFKHNESHFQNHYGYRGRERGRGRGSWSSRPVSTYSEDFDFTAMNEKFNKDEVWGHLGKSVRTHSADVNVPDEEDFHDENEAEASKSEVKPVYNKDDFFDSLSCDALNRNSHGGRGRFSEQRRVDTETFGEFSRYRGNRGGRWPSGYHGNFRGRGSYNGRGYGYNQRGRGRAIYTSAS